MANMRVMPPASGPNSIAVYGRTYTAAPGTVLDVPDFDAQVMAANGWTIAASGGVGASASRPKNPVLGTQYHDTTIGKNVHWDGKNWRDPATGSLV